MTETALHAHLVARGAVHADDRGVALPRHFGDPAAEYRALTRGAAVLDLGFRTLVRAVGPDRATFLQGMLTNDVERLAPGAGCAGAAADDPGARDRRRPRRGAADGAAARRRRARARRRSSPRSRRLLVADDVELAPAEATALLAVDGPDAARSARARRPRPVRARRDGGGRRSGARRARQRGARRRRSCCTSPAARAAVVWDALVAAGARPCGMEALEGRRVEVGVPRIGVDMGAKTLALEVPVEDAISITKGCYLGQEVVARGTARGHVNRRLVPPAARRTGARRRRAAGARRQGGRAAHHRRARVRRRDARGAGLRAPRALGARDGARGGRRPRRDAWRRSPRWPLA